MGESLVHSPSPGAKFFVIDKQISHPSPTKYSHEIIVVVMQVFLPERKTPKRRSTYLIFDNHFRLIVVGSGLSAAWISNHRRTDRYLCAHTSTVQYTAPPRGYVLALPIIARRVHSYFRVNLFVRSYSIFVMKTILLIVVAWSTTYDEINNDDATTN